MNVISQKNRAMAKAYFDEYRDKVIFTGLTFIVASMISWGTWVTLSLNDRLTQGEINLLISALPDPYLIDKKWVHEQLRFAEVNQDKMQAVIVRNTEAINALKVEIAKFAKSER